MGTRADFYVGRGESAEWIGSIAWDGYPDGIDYSLRQASSEEHYRNAVATFLAQDKSATLPSQGWPWPWDDSNTTDYAYAFDDGAVWATSFGYGWFKASEPEPEEHGDHKTAVFPNMKDRKAVTLGPRSGILLFQIAGQATGGVQ